MLSTTDTLKEHQYEFSATTSYSFALNFFFPPSLGLRNLVNSTKHIAQSGKARGDFPKTKKALFESQMVKIMKRKK